MHFAKHQTFYIRDGWLYKGLRHVSQIPTIFLMNESPQIFGLGVNMVESLRFWMQACGLTQEFKAGNKRWQQLTDFGELVLAYDPYQERDGTLWLLHYHLVCSRDQATSWYWFFNHYVPINFNRHGFVERLDYWITTQQVDKKQRKKAESSLESDFTCLVKTYLPRSNRTSPEDSMESPLAGLGLIQFIGKNEEDADATAYPYRLNTGSVKSIHPLIFLYVLLHRQEIERPEAAQLSLNVALRDPMNVGRVFNIGMSALEELLLVLEADFPQWRVTLTRTGGLDQLTLPREVSQTVLRAFYEDQSF